MSLVAKIRRHGLRGSASVALRLVKREAASFYYNWAVRNVSEFNDPTESENELIEKELAAISVSVEAWSPRAEDFAAFRSSDLFPNDYHGGPAGAVWDEKLLEHWVASKRLGFENYQPSDVYVDMAAGNSPWAQTLRNKFGISAYAIDMGEIGSTFKDLPFYKREDATATSFASSSVSGISMQCAFEMFAGNDDTNLVRELARILKPGGKAVIVPLYLHTHYCSYASPEYYGKGIADESAKQYVCRKWPGIPSARFYDAQALRSRVLLPIERHGMGYRLLVLRNKSDFGQGIYCHFILEITK